MMFGWQLFIGATVMLLGLGIPLVNKIGEEEDYSRLTLQDFVRFQSMTNGLIAPIFLGAALAVIGR